MTKKELVEKVGKKYFFTEESPIAAKLNYESGIESFDTYLCGKTLEQAHAVIHLISYPKGIVIKIAKLFSSFSFGLPYKDIKKAILSEEKEISSLIFEIVNNGKIIFSFKKENYSAIKKFLDDKVDKQIHRNEIGLQFQHRKENVADKYFYLDNKEQQCGPVTVDELYTAKIAKSTLVWSEGMNKWEFAGTLPELSGIFPPQIKHQNQDVSLKVGELITFTIIAIILIILTIVHFNFATLLGSIAILIVVLKELFERLFY